MRANFVVTSQPIVGDLAHFMDRVEDVSVQNLVAVGAVKSFDECVLIGLARLYEAKLNFFPLAPLGERVAGELRTVVAPNRRRLAVKLDQLFEETNNPNGGDTGRKVDAERAAVNFIQHV